MGIKHMMSTLLRDRNKNVALVREGVIKPERRSSCAIEIPLKRATKQSVKVYGNHRKNLENGLEIRCHTQVGEMLQRRSRRRT